MSTEILTMTDAQIARKLDYLRKQESTAVAKSFLSFLDTASTATSRATHYNSKQEQMEATEAVHKDLFDVDRSIYALSLLLGGVTDFSIQTGVTTLLGNARKTNEDTLLSPEQERAIINHLLRSVRPQKAFNEFLNLKAKRINNARVKKIILDYILGSSSLSFWAVKYRKKIASCLEHAWGQKVTGTIRSITAKMSMSNYLPTEKENKILNKHLFKYSSRNSMTNAEVRQSVGFLFGVHNNVTIPILKSFVEAKTDIERGKKLPLEVLEGIRSKYHKNVSQAKVLELTKSNLTTEQKKNVQRKARNEGVEVAFDPNSYDAVKLYLYAMEMGLTDEISEVLKDKAKRAAEKMFLNYDKIGIVVDTSQSMYGDRTQKLRPMAIALATRDMLAEVGQEATVSYTGNLRKRKLDGIVNPKGDSSIAESLVAVLKKEPDAVFVITDGYENAPAGRFAETVKLVRKIGNTTPIFQISPVMGSETQGTRALSEDVSVMPLNSPSALGIPLLKGLFEKDLIKGLVGLVKRTLPQLEG